ncbi:MAG TPA: tetratricopeptide repeat protein, partial [Candidatus Obscuribacterales bacterium]
CQNIEKAIDIYKQSLEIRTREVAPVDWAQTMNNLAVAYCFYSTCVDFLQNIEKAIDAYKQSLEVRTYESMPFEWATSKSNLAVAYYLHSQGNHAQDIEDAIDAHEQVLTVRTKITTPVEWAQTRMNMAMAYSDRIKGDPAENFQQAINGYQDSLTVFAPGLHPHDCRKSANRLGDIYFRGRRWQEAVSIYQTALQAAEILYQSANLLDSKSAELAETADLPRRAAYALARTGDLQKAVETLEQGRARGLSESLDRDRSDLTQLQQTHPKLYQDYQQITAQLRNLESQQRDRMTSEDRHSLTPEALRDTATSLRQQLTDVLQDIRKVLGYEDFLGLPTFADVQAAVQVYRPLV